MAKSANTTNTVETPIQPEWDRPTITLAANAADTTLGQRFDALVADVKRKGVLTLVEECLAYRDMGTIARALIARHNAGRETPVKPTPIHEYLVSQGVIHFGQSYWSRALQTVEYHSALRLETYAAQENHPPSQYAAFAKRMAENNDVVPAAATLAQQVENVKDYKWKCEAVDTTLLTLEQLKSLRADLKVAILRREYQEEQAKATPAAAPAAPAVTPDLMAQFAAFLASQPQAS